MARNAHSFKVSITLDEEDARFFRNLFKRAKQRAASADPDSIVLAARKMVESVRSVAKSPHFVLEAIQTLEDLVRIIEDEDWAAPKSVRDKVLAALAYFSDPEDLIPDDVPVLGFLDDAIVIKLMEDEFSHELAAYRKFRRFRDGAEQRPWTGIARERLPKRLKEKRDQLRAEVKERQSGGARGWLRL